MAESEKWVKLFESFVLTEAQLLAATLDAAGIPARLQGGTAATIWGDAPGALPQSVVEVRAEDIDAGREVMARLYDEQGRKSRDEVPEAWTCEACGERNPGDFDICWSCGATRGGEASEQA